MKKLLSLLLVFFPVFTTSVYAVDVNPASGNLNRNTTYTINIVADAPANATAVQLRLSITGATILSYTSPTGAQWGPGGIGACSGGTTYTSTQVCIELANTGVIADGTSLGSMSIRTGSSGSIIITKASDNGYLVGTTITPDTGTAGSYTIVASGSTIPTTLPNTAIDDNPASLIVIGSMILILSGLTCYILYPDFKNYISKQREGKVEHLEAALRAK